jgi:hypothetical protein
MTPDLMSSPLGIWGDSTTLDVAVALDAIREAWNAKAGRFKANGNVTARQAMTGKRLFTNIECCLLASSGAGLGMM